MKEVASVPGASLFRSIASIILITVFTVFFLYKTDELSSQAELVAVQRTVNQINVALSLVVYELAIKKNLDRLNVVNNQNPFYYLAISQELPENYFGVVRSETEIDKNGWFYEQLNQRVVYRSRENINYRYQLKFTYSDTNNSGSFESSEDKVTGLVMQQASN